MSIKAILFDLDGTLLPLDQDIFTKTYFKYLAANLSQYAYEPKALIDTVWTGTIAMMKNRGDKTNEEIFWETFSSIYGPQSLNDQSKFEKFYIDDFDKIKAICGYTEKSSTIISTLKEQGFKLALATAPLFPRIATEKRANWAGLNPKDFDIITTYENSRYSKPNLNYYLSIADSLSVDPRECLMVGNDVSEDMVASKVGMKVFLLTDNLLNKTNEDISVFPQGSFEDLLKYIDSEK